ncbi:hypothetical protein [Gracilibacillus dipsosauri]|uniref:Uncharacterized protein n=2 Tax=Gracilibacillus dipsosauri TaxID=178340 RepID=A0A317L0U5_9BACI|nr:hypothetical protein [Gracilibacillus dipsosauri]PWU68468.1 hypothetical protein DLJ74_08460 [Gracilibacillus dipsosauri]
MKFLSFLLVICVIFSFGLYVGMDRTDSTKAVSHQEEVIDKGKQDDDVVDREDIIDEINGDVPEVGTPGNSPLFAVANSGEEIVSKVCNKIVGVTHAIIDELF